MLFVVTLVISSEPELIINPAIPPTKFLPAISTPSPPVKLTLISDVLYIEPATAPTLTLCVASKPLIVMLTFIIAVLTTLLEPKFGSPTCASFKPTWLNKPKFSWTISCLWSTSLMPVMSIPLPSSFPTKTMSLILFPSTKKLFKVMELKSRSLIKRM